ncbi:hypothetical protein CVU82_00535 [Candidatus Falkowbacteria bacterium HGW-Falkowbacteria-1]|uniref:Uncharacterized protein n=1 Tax=Candidatus Falkowbacteria bacterium HGW-Falkowbacteria-1 TaxID=2013768 RepID=A0A2N2EAB3_9BACT|nr:MAG: hypothetical protein CVU82_00535 [Candidatus Falkowbacteria bacterium HGW-Falkowbacteria-1]
MVTSFSVLKFRKISSRKVEEKQSINSFVLRNNNGQLVQIRPGLCKSKPKSFFEKIFTGKDVPNKVIFVGNLETAQTRAANRHYYERVLKLTESKEYKLQEVVYNDPHHALEQEERGFVFSAN